MNQFLSTCIQNMTIYNIVAYITCYIFFRVDLIYEYLVLFFLWCHLAVRMAEQDKLGRIQSNNSGGFQKYGLLLVIIRILRCIGIFETNDILRMTALIHFLFLVKCGSACIFMVLQKPFSSGRKLSKSQWIYVFRHACLGILLNVVWLYGLTLCGPLRTILVFEHGEPILISMFVGLVSQKGNHARTRGSLMFFLGILCLLVFDNDDMIAEASKHPEGQHTSSISHALSSVISYLGVADHKGGILLLVVALFLKVGYNGYTKRISSLLGGVKRLNALSTLMTAVLLFPWTVLIYLTKMDIHIPSVLSLLLVVFFVFVIDHYGHAIVLGKLEAIKVSKLGYIVISLFALFLGFQWSHPAAVAISNVHGDKVIRTKEHVISGGVIVSTIFFILATDILSWPAPKSQKGSFIGYSSEGMPLYRFAGDVLNRASKSSFGSLAQGFLRKIFEEKESRRIFYFLCINLSFAFIELTWGIWSNSLGLVSDSFHMLFDCTALVLGLIAAVMAKWKPTRVFPYGYGRIEVLSGFVNGLFLVVIAIFLFYEAIQRLIDPPAINADKLMFVSVTGFFVNLVGVVVFSHQHHHGSHSHEKGHHHSNANIRGVYLHILADLLGSVGVIVSSFLIGHWQLLIADPICTLLVAFLVLSTVWPLLRDSAYVLSMCATPDLERRVRKAVADILALDGVISHRLCHVWQHTEHENIAVINVNVEPYVIEQRIISQVQSIFRSCGINTITVQVEKEAFYQHMSGLSCYPDDKLQLSIESYQQSFTPAKESKAQNDYTKLV